MRERIKEYADYKPREPEAVSAADIDGYKYTDRLQYRVWKKMLKIINRVTITLDPNTAHPRLTLSEDLMAVTRGSTRRDDVPDNLERFDYCVCVLGSEGFTSGRHSWVVDVGNKTDWDLGVARESINRKESLGLSPKLGYWTLVLRKGGKYYAGTDRPTRLELEKIPKKLLVYVDYEAGKVSFSNADDMSHIYTFTDNFTEKIFPYFSPYINPDTEKIEFLCDDIICFTLTHSYRPSEIDHIITYITVDSYKKEGKKLKDQSKSVCSQHREKLKLYCLEDQEVICAICHTSRKHKNHEFLPIEEAAQKFKTLEDMRERIKKYADYKPREPEAASAADIGGYKCTDCLQYRVWKKMLKIINPEMVTLDPNLTLSEDLTAVTVGDTRRKNLPDNPERFDPCPCVLGSEGFTLGKHSWVVDVENQTHCCLGVTGESAKRKGNTYPNLKPELGYWTVELYYGDYFAHTEEGWTRLEVLNIIKKVLVCMDYEAGKVSFFNADDLTEKIEPLCDDVICFTLTHSYRASEIDDIITYITGIRTQCSSKHY
nr:PREDICTED: zinc-binding protein A33-like [Latimeria chalumnae]|eukprot:XP_014353095.1 PREDICTED: zinc-binding protein A33-like [Latimeria chalumnae]